MPHVDEISRREFLNKGWTLTKAGLLVTPGLALLSAGCTPDTTHNIGEGPYKLKVTPEILSSGLEALVIGNYHGYIDEHHRCQAAIAVNSNNNPVIAYPKFASRGDVQTTNLGYATISKGQKWKGRWIGASIFVDESEPQSFPSTGDYNSVIIGGNDKVHICFSAFRRGYHKRGYNLGECLYYTANRHIKKVDSWVVKHVDKEKSVGLENDIAIDSNGKIHISHWAWNGSDLKYVTNASGKWISEILESAEWRPTSIAVDALDNVHIAYVGWNSRLYHITNESGIWESTRIPSGGVNSVLRIDSTGLINIISADSNFIYHSVKQSGVWNTSQLPFDYSPEYISQGSRLSMAVANDDSIMISYVVSDQSSYTLGKLYFATNQRGFWQDYLIDDKMEYANPSLAIDKDGIVHISVIEFVEQYNHILKYITFDPSQL